MTRESEEIAAAVDQFPRDTRERLRDSVLRLVEVYGVTTIKNFERVKVEDPPELVEARKVVSLQEWRARAG